MTTNLRDQEVLRAVSPLALSAYARSVGWSKTEEFGEYSDVYAGHQLPEILIPRTQRLGDYAQVVARLIAIFARAAEVDEVQLYNELVVADRDVFRIRANDGDSNGTIDLSHGVALINGGRELVLAAACSLREPRPVYGARNDREANEFLRRVRLGQTEVGSFVVTILSPIVPPEVQLTLLGMETDADPMERRITRRLAQALSAARVATTETMSGQSGGFLEAVSEGVSANLCEALVKVVEPFESGELSITWARTRPRNPGRSVVRFAGDDGLILREAARSFRILEARLDERLFGSFQSLRRDDSETEGTVTLRALVDGRVQWVTAVLSESDYNRAIIAHRERSPVIVEGDLDRFGQRWRLLNPRIVEIIVATEEEGESPISTP